jgi:hypothetical protein
MGQYARKRLDTADIVRHGDFSTVILIQMGQSCFLFFANAPQSSSQLTANLPARYTFLPAGEILEAPRTVKERR